MMHWKTEAEAREQIKALVAEYYHDFKEKKEPYHEGDRITYRDAQGRLTGTASQSGSNVIYGMGMMEMGMTMSYEQLLCDAEIVRMTRRILQGIRILWSHHALTCSL